MVPRALSGFPGTALLAEMGSTGNPGWDMGK